MMPLCTTTISPVQSRCGWAFSSWTSVRGRTAGVPECPPRTRFALAKSWWCTTASSKITRAKRTTATRGHKFVTETDTEIVAHLVEKNSQGGVPLEVSGAPLAEELRGIYALVFMSARDPRKIVAARMGPPSVIGLGEGEYFVASDIPALLAHTRQIFFLLTRHRGAHENGVRVMDHDGKTVNRPAQHVSWDPIMAEKGGYKHFMQKEISSSRAGRAR